MKSRNNFTKGFLNALLIEAVAFIILICVAILISLI